MKLRVMSLCSGAGGMDMAFHWNEKFEVIGVSEIDKHANAVLKYHHGGIKNYGDITKIVPRELPNFDVCIAGTPCQDLSVAGKRKGLSGRRSGLFYNFIEIIKEKAPSYFIWENVKGTLSSQRGWDLARVQIEMAEAGYDIEFHVLNANEFGIPQSRERIFIIGYNRVKGGFKILRQQFSSGKDACGESEITKNIEKVGDKTPTGAMPMIATRSHGKLKRLEQFNCIDANYYKGYDNHGQRSLIAYSKSTRESHIDHRVKVDESANTLNTGEGCRTMSSANFIEEKKSEKILKLASVSNKERKNHIKNNTTPDSPIKKELEGKYIATRYLGRNGTLATDECPTIQTMDIPHKVENKIKKISDKAPTTGKKSQSSTVYDNKGISPNVTAGCHGYSMGNIVDADDLRIRKLTPIECERLMGWNDNHTQFGYYEDTKKILEVSDTQRYRMCGNGVVPQCIEAIIKVWRI